MMIGNSYDWYKLSFVKGLGPKSAMHLYKSMVGNRLTISDIFNMKEKEYEESFPMFGKGKFAKLKLKNFKDINDAVVSVKYQSIVDAGINVIGLSDELYPKKLKKSLKGEAPSVLYSQGNSKLLNCQVHVSIVGSRAASENLLEFTSTVSSEISKHGYNIVSGYAKGVDDAGHLGALMAGGSTIAVLPQGLTAFSARKEYDRFSESRDLLYISQFYPNEGWKGRNAMRRNKVVVGLADYIVVMESGPERDEKGRMSGTFNSGQEGIKLNIPVYVLNPEDRRLTAKGNLDLIKIGATPFKTTEELISLIKNKVQNSKNILKSVQTSLDL